MYISEPCEGNQATARLLTPWQPSPGGVMALLKYPVNDPWRVTWLLHSGYRGEQSIWGLDIWCSTARSELYPISFYTRPWHEIYRIMHELPWVTIFGSLMMRFANRHSWKSLANCITSDPTIVSNSCTILFLMSWTHNSAKNKYDRWFRHCRQRRSFSELWRHHIRSVTSRKREVLALWRHIRRLFVHALIGAKAIFASE